MRLVLKRNNTEKMPRKESIGATFFLLVMFVFIFTAYRYNETSVYIDIPYISLPTLPLYLVIGVSVAFFLIGVINHMKGDIVILALLLRLLLPLIPALYLPLSEHFLVNYITSILCVIAYLMGLNFTSNRDAVKNTVKIIFFIVCLQTIVESFIGKNTFFSGVYAYKHDLTIPIGASNAIASRIIPCFAFIYAQERDKKHEILYVTLMSVAVILTKSRGGIIMALLVFGISIVWKGRMSLKSTIRLIIVLTIIGVAFYYFTTNTLVGSSAFSNYEGTLFTRYGLWNNGISLFNAHPILGNGFSQESLSNNYHNFIIQILVRSGLVGMFLFVYILAVIIGRVKPYLHDNYVRAGALFGICILGQGLVEVILFNYISDIMLWFITGCMISRCNALSNQNDYTGVAI